LAALQNLPQFQQIRQLVAQNPQALQQILPAIQMQQPQLFEYIQQHPEEFMALLQGGGGGPEGGMPGMPGMMPGGAPPPGTQVIQLNPEEREAIERIQSMGFERNAVVEAYLVCDKNEEAAINFLLNNATFAD
jgi:UV excision repair protein RAD23